MAVARTLHDVYPEGVVGGKAVLRNAEVVFQDLLCDLSAPDVARRPQAHVEHYFGRRGQTEFGVKRDRPVNGGDGHTQRFGYRLDGLRRNVAVEVLDAVKDLQEHALSPLEFAQDAV